jgi:P4 family phage/plasmid primase-like protien
MNLNQPMDAKMFYFKGKPVTPSVCAGVLKYSQLENLKVFPWMDLYYLYDPSEGIYQQYNDKTIPILISSILSELKDWRFTEYLYVTQVCKALKVGKWANVGLPLFSKAQAFTNGVLDLRALDKGLQAFDPKYFVNYKHPFAFDPGAKCPNFLEFLHIFCGGLEDRKLYVRAIFHLCVMGLLKYQVFPFIYGPGSTGKSTLTQMLTALVGRENTVTTSMKALNSNTFEVVNLNNKRLIFINELEKYVGDYEIFKQMVGGDSLSGRVKYIQGNIEFHSKGIVVVVSNYLMTARDSSNSLRRRMLPLLADSVTNKREYLLEFDSELMQWIGPLSKELSGIFH